MNICEEQNGHDSLIENYGKWIVARGVKFNEVQLFGDNYTNQVRLLLAKLMQTSCDGGTLCLNIDCSEHPSQFASLLNMMAIKCINLEEINVIHGPIYDLDTLLHCCRHSLRKLWVAGAVMGPEGDDD